MEISNKRTVGFVSRIVLVGLFLMQVSASAGTFTSTSATPSWTTVTGWTVTGGDAGAVGPVGDDVVIAHVISNYANSGAFNSLTINLGASLPTTDRNITVTGNTIVNGTLSMTTGGTKSFNDITVDGTWTGGTVGVTISGNLTVNSGALFTSGAGAYTFTGVGGSKTIGGTLTPLGITRIIVNSANPISFNGGGTLNVTNLELTSNTFTIAASKTLAFNATASIIRSNGSIINSGNAITYVNTVSLSYINTTNITTGAEMPSVATALSTLSINCSGFSVALGSNARPNGNVTITNGTLDLSTFTLIRNAGPASTLNLNNASTLLVPTSFPSGFSTYTLNGTSTVNYTGTNQNIGNANHINLVTSGSGIKTLTGNITATSLTIGSGTTFDPSSFNIIGNPISNITGTFSDGLAAGTNTLGAVTLNNGAVMNSANTTATTFTSLTIATTSASIGSGLFTVSGTTIANGILNITGTGLKTFTGNVTLTATTGGWNNSGNAAVSLGAALTINNATSFIVGSGGMSVTGTLTLNNGGTWNNSANSAITFGGTIGVANGSTFTAGSGLYTFTGAAAGISGSIASLTIPSININSAGTVTNNIAILNIETALNLTSGTFTNAASRTINFGSGSTITRIAGSITNDGNALTYAGLVNLVYSNSANISTGLEMPTSPTVLGTLTVNTAAANILTLASNVSPNGAVTINSGTLNLSTFTCNLNSGSFGFALNGTASLLASTIFPSSYNAYTFASGSTVNYNGAAQNVLGGVSYGNLTISGTTTKTLTVANATVQSNLNISAGTLDLGAFTLNRTAAGGTITVAAGTSLLIGGASTSFPSNFTTRTVNATSTVEYKGSTQTVTAGFSYGHLVISGTATQTAATTVVGNFSLSGSGTYSTGTVGVLAITGTLSVPIGTVFTIGDAPTTTTHTVGGAATIDGTITYAGASLAQGLTITGDLSGAGTIQVTGLAGAKTLTLNGANNSIGNYIGSTNGTVTYSRAGAQSVFASTNYNTLTFGGSGIKSISGTTSIAQNLTVPINVTLFLNANTFNSGGTITVNSGGTLSVDANATLNMNGASITNAGTFSVVGIVGQPATVSRGVAGNYIINQTAGTFNAQYYVFDKLGATGITISAGTIDGTNNFSNGTFSNGLFSGVVGNAYLNFINLALTTNASNVVFGTNATNPLYNVSRIGNAPVSTGTITFQNWSGTIGGQAFEYESLGSSPNGLPRVIPGTLIDWSISGTTFYSQNPIGNFSDLSNWNEFSFGGGATPTVAQLTDGSSDFIVQAGHIVTLDQNINIKNLSVENTGELSFNSAIARTASVNGDILNDGSIKIGATTAVHTLNFLGATFTNNGVVDLFGSASRSVITNMNGVTMTVGGSASPIFAELNFNNQAPPYTNSTITAGVGFIIKGNVTFVTGAVFNDGGFVHTVARSWTQATSAQMTGSGTLEFVGSGIQSISSGSGTCTFHNLTFRGGNSPSVGGMVVNGNFLVTNNTTVSTSSNNTYSGTFTVDNGSTYTQSSGTATFNSSVLPQTVDVNNATFSAVTFSGIVTKDVLNNLTATGAVIISAGSTVTGIGNQTITGGLTINGTCDWNGNITLIGGSITRSTAGTIDLDAQLIIAGTVSAGTAGTAIALNMLAGNVTVTSGVFTINNLTTITGALGFGLTVNSGSTLRLNGVDNFPTGFDDYTFATGSTVDYIANIPSQTIRGGVSYSNLRVQNNTKTADANLVVLGNLDYVAAGSNATSLVLNGFKSTISGNVINTNITNSLIATSNGKVTFDNPNNAQTFATGTYNIDTLSITLDAPTTSRTKTFNNGSSITTKAFLVSNAGGDVNNRLIVNLNNNEINSTSGTFSLGINTSLFSTGASSLRNTLVPSRFTTIALDDSSLVRYSGSNAQDLADGFSYGSIELANTFNKVALAALDINGNVSAVAGAPVFVDGGFTHTVAGNWSLGTGNYNTTASSGTVQLDGLDQSIVGSFINLEAKNGGTKTVTTAGITVFGNVTIDNGVTVDANIRPVVVHGNWLQNGTGVFSQSTGVTSFVGVSALPQTITIGTPNASTFGGLTIRRANGNTPSANITVVTNSTIRVRARLDIQYVETNPGCSAVTPLGKFDITDDTLYVGADLVVRPAATLATPNASIDTTFITKRSTVILDGSTPQIVYLGNPVVEFNNLYFKGEGSKTFSNGANACISWARNYVINGNFDNELSVINAQDRPISVKGNWTNTGDFQHATNAVVTFNGVNQTIGNSSFHSVVLAGTGTKTLGGDMTVNGSLTINSGVTFDVGTPINYTINLVGSWLNNGAFTAREGTVNITSPNTLSINTGGANTTTQAFYNLNIANSSCNLTSLTNATYVINDLTIANGSALQNGAFPLSVGRNFLNNDRFNQVAGGSLNFEDDYVGTRSFIATSTSAICPASAYGAINVNATGSNIIQDGNVTVTSAPFNLNAGTYRLNSNILSFNANNASELTIATGAVLDIDSGASLIAFDTIINNGTFRMVGTAAEPAQLGRVGASLTLIQANPAALIQASNYAVTGTTGRGIQILQGSIDPVHNFRNGAFSNGANGVGNAYLSIHSSVIAALPSSLTLSGMLFNAGTGVGSMSNIKVADGVAYYGTKTISIQNAAGALSGFAFENDNPSFDADTGWFRWTFPNAKFWDGNGSNLNTSWNTAANWHPDGVPTASDTVYIDNSILVANYSINVDVADTARVASMIIQRTGSNTISLNVQDKSLKIGKGISTGIGCTLNGGSGTIIVGGSWSNTGTFTQPNTSTVILNGSSLAFSVASGGQAFYNFYLKGNNAAYSLSNALVVANDLTINPLNTLDVSSSAFNVTVGGNWLNNGTFNPRVNSNARVTFNKTTGTQSITNGPFNDLYLTGTTAASKQLLSNLTVSRDINIGANSTFDVSANNVYVGRHWTNDNVGTGFSQTTGSTVYFTGAGQNIDNGAGAATSFQNVTLLGSGTKTLFKNSIINGDFLVAAAGVNVDFRTHSLVGNGSTSQYIVSSNGTSIVRGNGTFLTDFPTVSLASNSTVQYIPFDASFVTQSIQSLPNNTAYGNLTLSTRVATELSNKNITEDIVVAGNISIADSSQLNVNNKTITLTGNLALASAGTRQINWGTAGGTGTLVHNGTAAYYWQNSWNISPNIKGFNNLILAGSQRKSVQSDLSITGDLTVQGGVTLEMNANTITGTSGKVLVMQNASRLESAVATADGVAFPNGFGTYNVDPGSTTVLDGIENQTLFTTPVYGNLSFANNNVVRDVTVSPISPLTVSNTFNISQANFIDGDINIFLGGDLNTNDLYIPGTGKWTLFGDNQLVTNPLTAPQFVRFNKLSVTGTGRKTVGNGNITFIIYDSLYIDTSLQLYTTRPVQFFGNSWNNAGVFNNTNSTRFLASSGKVFVSPGPEDPANFFSAVLFETADSIKFVNNGGDFNGAFTVNGPGIVDLGTVLTHKISGIITLSDSVGGSWYPNNANIILDGGNQTIPGPLVARDVTCATNGTKSMAGKWSIRNLTINSGVTFTHAVDSLIVSGDFTNNGTFNHGNQLVYLNGASNRNITLGTSSFYDLIVAPTATATYKLLSNSTRVLRKIEVREDATLKLNSKILIHGNGNSITGKTLDVLAGAVLEVDTSASLQFDNRNGNICTANIAGTLNLIGTSIFPATLTRFNTGGQFVNITGNIAANNYVIEYLSTTGLNLASSVTVDATNNFSNGTFSNLNATAGSAYITSALSADITTPPITNVIFNYTGGTPTVGQQFNIKHVGLANITFTDPISGALGCGIYKGGLDSAKVILPACTQITWTGSVSSNWHTPANWSPSVVPDSLSDVFIPNVTNDPVISTADAYSRSLTITNGILALDPSTKLFIIGDANIGNTIAGSLLLSDSTNTVVVKGNWTKGTSGTFNAGSPSNSGNVKFTSAGSVNINNRNTAFGNIEFAGSGTFNISAGNTINSTANSFAVTGNVTMTQGIVNPSSGTIFIGGDFIRTGGTYGLTGTAAFNSTSTQTISGASLNNVLFLGESSTKRTIGAVSFAGTTTMQNDGITLQSDSGSVITFGGNVSMSSFGSTFNVGNSVHLFNGANWSSDGINILGGGSVQFNAGNQTINQSNLPGLIFAGTGTKTIAGDVSLTLDFIVNSGLTVNTGVFTVSSSNGVGNFTLGSASVFNVVGANNFPVNFSSYSLACNSTVNYNAISLNQTVRGIDYGNLTLTGGAPTYSKTLDGGINVCTNLTIAANTTLDVSENNYDVSVSGNFNNNNLNGSFNARNGIVYFTGSGNQSLNVGVSGQTGTKTLFKVYVDKSSGTLSHPSNGTVNILNDLIVNNGTYSLATSDTVFVGANLQVINGTIANNTHNLVLKATTPDSYIIQTNSSSLAYLSINSDGSTYTLQDNLNVRLNFRLLKGTFDGNALYHTFGDGNLRNVNIDGIYKIGAGGTMALANQTTVTIGLSGVFEAIGSIGNIATVTNTVANSRYNFAISGTISASNYLFEYMRASGMSVLNTATVSPFPNNFSEGVFANGTSGGVYLSIDNAQTLDTLFNVTFNTNPGGGARNVAKTGSSSGKIVFKNANGAFAGPTFENDPYNKIDWVGSLTLNWTGNVSTDWFNPLNWSPNFVPTIDDNAVIVLKTNQPIIGDKPSSALCKNLTVGVGAELKINSTDDVIDLVVASDVTIDGIFLMNTTSDSVFVGGNWTRGTSGAVNPGSGAIVFVGESGFKTINNRTSSFGNMVINSTASYVLGASTTISKSLNIINGTLDANNASNFNLLVGGNWYNNGTFLGRAATVTFISAAATTYDIKAGTSGLFNNMIISGGSSTTYRLVDTDLTVNGNFTLTSGNFNLNSKQFNFGDGIGSDVLNVFDSLNLNANSSLSLGSNASINVASGVFSMIGANESNRATVTANSGKFSFVVNSGAQIRGRYYAVSGLNTAGLIVRSGAILGSDSTNLSDGVFSNGSPAGTYITFQNDFAVGDTIYNVTFNSGASKNVTRISGNTTPVVFKDAGGVLGGFLFEVDNNSASTGRVVWKYTNTQLTWTGNAENNDWFDFNNWKNQDNQVIGIPDTLTLVTIPTNPDVNPNNFPIIKSSSNNPSVLPAKAKDLTLQRSASLIIQDNSTLTVDGVLTNVGATITSTTGFANIINVSKSVDIANNSSPSVAGIFNGGNAIINVAGDWKVTGTFNGQSSIINMNATSGTHQFYNNNGTVNNLNFSGASTYQLPNVAPANTNLTVIGNLSIGTGSTLSNLLSSRIIQVNGNWTNNGTFNHGSGIVLFGSGSALQSIGGTSITTFNILTMNGLGVKRLDRDINVQGDFTVGQTSPSSVASNLNLNGKNVDFSGSNFRVLVGTSQLIRGGNVGTFNFNRSGDQTVSIAATTNKAFYNLTKSVAGTLFLNSDIDVQNDITISAGTTIDATLSNRAFNLAGNWINNGTFLSRNGVVGFYGINVSISKSSGRQVFYTLIAGTLSNLTLNAGVDVQNALFLDRNGIITTGSNSIALTSSSSFVIRTASTNGNYVDGSLVKTYSSSNASYTFEVGSAGIYSPVTITPSVSTSGTVTVKAFNSDSPNISTSCLNATKSVNRYWNITKTIPATYNATFNYTAALSDVGVVPASFGLSRYNGSWTYIAPAPTPTATSLTANAISLTGDFQIAEAVPSASIVSDAPSNTICAGTDVLFTATPVNGGGSPTFQWTLNGSPVGSNSSTYSNAGLLNGAQVRVGLTNGCLLSSNSNTITMTVNALPTVNAGSPLSPICQSGTTLTLGGSVGGGAAGGTWSDGGAGGSFNPSATNLNATYTASISSGSPITLTLTTSGGFCGSVSDNKLLTVNPLSFTWTGSSDNVWNNTGNWSCGIIPTATSDVLISTGTPSIGNTPVAVVRNLDIQNPSVLQIASSGTLQVYGNWTNTGTFTPNSGTVEFLGTSAQSITNAGTENFYNLTVNKSSGTLTVNANTDILATNSGTLSVLSGTLDVAASKKITFKSSAPIGQVDRTARLGRVGGTITPTSTFVSERYIKSPSSRFPYVTGTKAAPSITLAPSLKNVLSGDWSDNIKVVYGTSSSTLSNYSELNGSGVNLQDKINRGWRFVLNNSTALTLGRGYRIFAGLDSTDDVVSITGNVHTGNYSVPVTYSATGTQGWNLLGNPYPCEINFDDVYAANSAVIQPNMYIMDPYNSTNGTTFNNSTYYTYNAFTNIAVDPRVTLGTARTAATGKYIPSSQGFFVKALSSITTGNVLFTESMKPLAPYTSVYGNFRQAEEKQLVRVSVSDGGVDIDQAVVHFTDMASNSYDELYDAQALSSGSLNVYTVASGKNLVINGLKPATTGLSIPLVVKSKLLGKKSFIVDENTVSFGKLYIRDKYTGITTLIGKGTVYEFDITTDTSSSSMDRFTIVNSSSVVTDIDEAGNGNTIRGMEMYPNPYIEGDLTVSIRTKNMEVTDMELMSLDGTVLGSFSTKDFARTSEGLSLKLDIEKLQLSSGVYLVKCNSGDRSFIERLVITK